MLSALEPVRDDACVWEVPVCIQKYCLAVLRHSVEHAVYRVMQSGRSTHHGIPVIPPYQVDHSFHR